MTMPLPDPRRFVPAAGSSLLQKAEDVAAAEVPERVNLQQDLAQAVASMIDLGEEAQVRMALRQPSSPKACRVLYAALEAALTRTPADAIVIAQVFAIPVLFVVGAQSAARLPGVLPEPGAVEMLFERAGVLGHCRNFAISNALCAIDSLSALPWKTLRAVSTAQDWNGLETIDLAPADISITANRDAVHLRYITGAALTPVDAPAFTESAGEIGRWGMQLTRELGRQLSAPDCSVLPIARSPQNIVRAIQEGWFAARELGFQLFLSNALRDARMRIGEPDVEIVAVSDQTIRVRLTSPFDELLDQCYGWPLEAADDFGAVVDSIVALLDDVKLQRVIVKDAVEKAPDGVQTQH